MIDALKPVLERNFAALGWELLNVGVFPDHNVGQHVRILRGTLRCPCGDLTYFNLMIAPADLTHTDALAVAVLEHAAGREHLEADVAGGSLSPFDIDKYMFKGELL